MAVQLQGNSGVVAEVDGTTHRAQRGVLRPNEALGHYMVDAYTGLYAGVAALGSLFSFRWTDATRLAVISYCEVSVITSVGFTAAQIVDRDLVVFRGSSAVDTGGTLINAAGNNLKLRTSFPTSLVGEIRIATTAALGKGAGGAEDAQAIGLTMDWATLAAAVAPAEPPVQVHIDRAQLFNPDQSRGEYPLVLAQNEGVRVRIPTLMGAGGTQRTRIKLAWSEVASY